MSTNWSQRRSDGTLRARKEPAALLRGMASRSRRYVLVLIPNALLLVLDLAAGRGSAREIWRGEHG